MKKLLPLFAVAIFLTGCENPERTADQVKKDIAAFRANPGAATQAVVEKDLDRLDQQIDDLEKKASNASGDAALKLSDRVDKLRARRMELGVDFKAARMGKLVEDFKNTARDIGNSLKNFGDSVQKQMNKSDTTADGN